MLISVAENTTAVGTLTATDPDASDTSVGYTVSGTDDDLFSISAGASSRSGPRPTTRARQGGALDDSNEYTFAVLAQSGSGSGNLSVLRTVRVTVTEADEPPGEPAASTFGATTGTSIEVHWTAPANTGPVIMDYDLRFRRGTSGGWDTSHDHTGTATTATLTGLTMGDTYLVQVRATNAEGTGAWSASGAATATANRAPAFQDTPYAFTLAENADGSTTAIDVGTVEATDADAETVTYSIEAGDTDGVFAHRGQWHEPGAGGAVVDDAARGGARPAARGLQPVQGTAAAQDGLRGALPDGRRVRRARSGA